MFYSKVVNLPTANTPYLIRTLLVALDPAAPVVLANAKIKAVTTNTGSIAVGSATMTSVDDGNRLEIGEFDEQGGSIGIVLDTSAEYLIGSAVNQKALIQGTTY
jgi:hypothetical protein